MGQEFGHQSPGSVYPPLTTTPTTPLQHTVGSCESITIPPFSLSLCMEWSLMTMYIYSIHDVVHVPHMYVTVPDKRDNSAH